MAKPQSLPSVDVAALEQERAHVERQLRAVERQLTEEQSKTTRLQNQARTLQTLTLGLFSMLEAAQIYALACETVVYQLGWDTAFVLSLHGNRGFVEASFQATQKQLELLHDYLGQDPYFREIYSQKQTLASHKMHDKPALAMRALFQTDEVVLTPLLFAEHLYGYLVVCAHTHRGGKSTPDLDFIASVASHIAHAAYISTSFSALEQQNTKLRELDEIKNSFISITSHQLRTPLSIVKWILSILQGDTVLQEMPKQLELINQAYESNERLIHVVNDLLNVSRIQEGRLPHNPQLLNIVDILKELTEGVRKASDSHHLSVELHSSVEALPLEIDPLLFKEAMQNILDNAIDYNIPGGWIKVGLTTSAHKAEVTIESSGPGIPAADLTKIFDQFYRSPEAVKMQPNGNGLGLYLVKAIITQHGGEVSCASVMNDHTTFTISLPIP